MFLEKTMKVLMAEILKLRDHNSSIGPSVYDMDLMSPGYRVMVEESFKQYRIDPRMSLGKVVKKYKKIKGSNAEGLSLIVSYSMPEMVVKLDKKLGRSLYRYLKGQNVMN